MWSIITVLLDAVVSLHEMLSCRFAAHTTNRNTWNLSFRLLVIRVPNLPQWRLLINANQTHQTQAYFNTS